MSTLGKCPAFPRSRPKSLTCKNLISLLQSLHLTPWVWHGSSIFSIHQAIVHLRIDLAPYISPIYVLLLLADWPSFGILTCPDFGWLCPLPYWLALGLPIHFLPWFLVLAESITHTLPLLPWFLTGSLQLLEFFHRAKCRRAETQAVWQESFMSTSPAPIQPFSRSQTSCLWLCL